MLEPQSETGTQSATASRSKPNRADQLKQTPNQHLWQFFLLALVSGGDSRHGPDGPLDSQEVLSAQVLFISGTFPFFQQSFAKRLHHAVAFDRICVRPRPVIAVEPLDPEPDTALVGQLGI